MTDKKYALPTVEFSSDLVRQAFALERLRGDFGNGTTPAHTLTELHALFQIVTSVVSARIEGNRTTIYDALQGLSEPQTEQSLPEDPMLEIRNLIEAMTFITSTDITEPLTHVFVRELHRITVSELKREGDPTPGSYRANEVIIQNSNHHPPSNVYVHTEMTDLLAFINREGSTHEQMIHTAIAHHRFLWVHPFGNGNGRVSRLLSFAMLRKHGFAVGSGMLTMNPTAVFGSDRDGYYAALEAADDLSNDGTIKWCTFFVSGLHKDLERMSRMQDFDFVRDSLVEPAISRLVRSGGASSLEAQILLRTLEREVVKAGDLEPLLQGTPSSRSVTIRSLLGRGLLQQDARGPRFYRLPIATGPLAPMIIRQLDEFGYLPEILRD